MQKAIRSNLVYRSPEFHPEVLWFTGSVIRCIQTNSSVGREQQGALQRSSTGGHSSYCNSTEALHFGQCCKKYYFFRAYTLTHHCALTITRIHNMYATILCIIIKGGCAGHFLGLRKQEADGSILLHREICWLVCSLYDPNQACVTLRNSSAAKEESRFSYKTSVTISYFSYQTK